MPRDSNGNWTPPSGNPVTSGTTITASWWNAMLSDIQTEISNSLARQGNGAGLMLAALKQISGSVGAPSYSFTADNTTGWFLNAAGDLQFTISGQVMFKLTNALAARILGLGSSGSSAAGLAVDTQFGISTSTPIQTWAQNGVQQAALLGDGSLTLGASPNASSATRHTDVTRALVAANGMADATSASCGTFSTAAGTYVDVTNLSVSTTSSGGPVLLILISDGSANNCGTAVTNQLDLQWMRDGARIGGIQISPGSTAGWTLSHVDYPSGGAHTWKIQAKSTNAALSYYKLFVHEFV